MDLGERLRAWFSSPQRPEGWHDNTEAQGYVPQLRPSSYDGVARAVLDVNRTLLAMHARMKEGLQYLETADAHFRTLETEQEDIDLGVSTINFSLYAAEKTLREGPQAKPNN